MIGTHLGRNFQVTISGGSYQDGLSAILQGHPPGMLITEQELYGDLLLRKPGADELSSPRVEPDLPIIYTGVNAADTVEGAGNKGMTNGTPLTILIPNLDRHFVHIKQYQDTNRTPRPGHCSFASFKKYGPWDDAIGAGIFSGRYTSTIVAAGHVARRVLEKLGIHVFAYVKEAAGVVCPDVDSKTIYEYNRAYRQMRADLDPFYQEIYVKGRITPDMRFLEKARIFGEIENEIAEIRAKAPVMSSKDILDKYKVNHVINCPDSDAADAMIEKCNAVSNTGDSTGGIVEVIATGVPVGLGEPVFYKLDAELGRMLGIGAVKAVEVGSGYKTKDMTGIESNDQMYSENGEVKFTSNNAGGITGGLSTGQDIVARLTVKPTPTIDKPQKTIDKYTNENKELEAITRRDPTIVARIWPVAEAMTSITLLDHMFSHMGYQEIMKQVSGK